MLAGHLVLVHAVSVILVWSRLTGLPVGAQDATTTSPQTRTSQASLLGT